MLCNCCWRARPNESNDIDICGECEDKGGSAMVKRVSTSVFEHMNVYCIKRGCELKNEVLSEIFVDKFGSGYCKYGHEVEIQVKWTVLDAVVKEKASKVWEDNYNKKYE